MSLPFAPPCALAAALLACAALAAPAPAAVAGAGKSIIVTSNTSDVSLTGFADNAAVTLVRDGLTIATGTNRNVPATSPAEGGVNSTHVGAAGGCWNGFTTQLLPGDQIRIGADNTVVQDVTAEPLAVEGGEFVRHAGTVRQPGARAQEVV